MSAEKLAAAIQAVDWNTNVKDFLSDAASVHSLAAGNMRLAVWARQFEGADKGNPALAYIRDMQVASQQLTAVIALALYRSAGASMRNILEAGLYYSYFRTHPSELATLIRDPAFYIDKQFVLEFHKRHTPRFVEMQTKLGLVARMDKWYRSVSAIVHGQIPGAWSAQTSLHDVKHTIETRKSVIDACIEGEDIVHRLFLCTAGNSLWDGFSASAKGKLLAGLPGDAKTLLGLEGA